MSEKTTVRISKKLKEAIDRDIKEHGIISFNEWAVKAFEHIFDCNRAYPVVSMRLIVLKYLGKCLKCKRQVDVGEWAYYGRGVGIICLDCSIQRTGDKTLIAWDLKLRKTKRLCKVYEKHIDEMAAKVEIYIVAEKHQETDRRRNQIYNLVEKFLRLREHIGAGQERQAIKNLMERDKELSRFCDEMEEWLRSKLMEPIRKKRKAKQVA